MSEHALELRFEMIRLIGSGGEADVYLVRHRQTGRIYACKLLREAWDPIARERFRREARRQRRLAGEHVVELVGWNVEAESPFLILEYMPKGSLADAIKRQGRFGAVAALRILRKIAVALANLHKRGVVHRDLKPGNILCAADGCLKLNDFGVAATATFSELRASRFVGTVAYAAPEQAAGVASAKSDVFAMGVMLYELVVGVPCPRPPIASLRLGPVTQQINALIARLSAEEPRSRPTAVEAIGLIDEALRALRLASAGAAAPAAFARDDNVAWGWFIGGAALIGTVALFSRSEETWDASVGRYRGLDGQFRPG